MKENKVYNLSDVIPDGTQLPQSDFIYVGDWVYIPAINEKGKVIGVYFDKEWDERGYHVRMQDGRELKVLESNCQLADYDPKTAFLHDLSELLRRHNAKIRWSIGLTYEDRIQSSANIEIHTPNFDHYFSGETGVTLTSDNIFNYKKE